MTRELGFADAIEVALDDAMTSDERVVVLGEDVRLLRRNLLVRHGPDRVRDTPISESAFLGAAVTAAMSGLRPVVEIMLIDFVGVAFDALLNHAAKFEFWSGGDWPVPLVVRASCGGWYGDGGQHEQVLWGMLAGVPGLNVVAPSTPADAAGLMRTAIEADEPVVFLEHKLLSGYWLDYLGGYSRVGVDLPVPECGATGPVPDPVEPLPLGVAATRRRGTHVALVSVGVGVHRCLEAAESLAAEGIECRVVDLRSIAPLDRAAVARAARDTGRVVVVDEDYLRGGLTGEVAAILAEEGVAASFARVAVESTIPYSRRLEEAVLPNADRIIAAARELLSERESSSEGRSGATAGERHDRAAAVIEELARALDSDDFDRVAELIAPDCLYTIGDSTHVGSEAIADSYRAGSSLARSLFDSVDYDHRLIERRGDTFRMDFADLLTVRDDVLEHHSIQEITVGPDGLVARIADVTPAEERERVTEFERRHELRRPG